MAEKTAEEIKDVAGVEDELEVAFKDAVKQPGRTPKDLAILLRELQDVLRAIKMAPIGEIGIGTYFVPNEGQLGVEGLIKRSAAYMNQWVQEGWQPWQMATPYAARYAFELDGMQTGALDGQWITIIWAKPAIE